MATELGFGCNADIIFGQYRVLYDVNRTGDCSEAVEMGITEGVYVLTFNSESIPISNTNRFGNSDIDGIYVGGNCALAITFKEWNIEVATAAWPYGRANISRDGIVGMGASGAVGQSECLLASCLILDPITGPASLTSPNTRSTLRAPKALMMPNHGMDVAIGLAERNFGQVFKLWPVEMAIPGTSSPVLYESRWFYWDANADTA